MVSSSLVINAEIRNLVGKADSRKFRRAGKIPAVVYFKGESFCINLDFKYGLIILKLLSVGNTLLKLNVKDSIFYVLIKHVHMHPYKIEVLHFDFQKVEISDYVTTDVKFRFINDAISPGIKSGGVLIKQILSTKVFCKVCDIPSFINIDLANLNVNQSIYLSDLVLSNDIKLSLLKHEIVKKQIIASIGSSKVSQVKEVVVSDKSKSV